MADLLTPLYLAAGASGALIRAIQDAFARPIAKEVGPESASDIHLWAETVGLTGSDDIAQRFGRTIYRRMCSDPYVKAGFVELLASVLAAPLRILPGGESRESVKAAEFCAQNITLLGRGSRTYPQHSAGAIYELARTALVDGLCLAERVWRREADGRVWLDYLAFRPCEEYLIHSDTVGRITHLTGQAAANIGQRYEPWQFLIAPWGCWFGNWLGQSEGYAAYKPYAVRELARKLHGIMLQKGAGALVGKMPYKSWVNQSESLKFFNALKKLNSESVAVIPEEWSWEVVQVARENGAAFTDAMERYGKEILIGLLGSTLPTESGPTGTQALGTVQQGTRDKRSDLVRAFLCSTIEKELLEPVCDLNFMTDSKSFNYPVATLDSEDSPETYLMRITQLAGLGATFRPRDVEARVGIELANDDEELIGGRPPQAQPFDGPFDGPTDEPTERPAKQPDATMPGAERAADTALNGAQVASLLDIVERVATGAIPRETGINLITAAFPLSEDQAERLMGAVGRGFRPAVPEQAQLAEQRIAPKRLRIRQDWQRVDKAADALIETMDAPYKAMIEWAIEHRADVEKGELAPGADDRLQAFRDGLRESMRTGVMTVADTGPRGAKMAEGDAEWPYGDFIPERAIDELRDEIGDTYWAKYEETLWKEFEDLFEEAAREGWSNEQIADKMREKAGTAPGEAPAEEGKPREDNWRMRRTARQANADAYNRAKGKAMADAPWVDAIEIIGPDDDRETPFCEEVTGRVYAKDDPDLLLPTYHWGCRRSHMPVMSDEPGVKIVAWKDNKLKPEPGFGHRIGG